MMTCDICGADNAAQIRINGAHTFRFCGKASCWTEISKAVGAAISKVAGA